jgi:plasmid maintenance system antidote protein VapI
MDLKTYLDSIGLNHNAFAKIINVHPNTISNYLHWRKKPDPEIIKRIEIATEGIVQFKDMMYYWELKQKNG